MTCNPVTQRPEASHRFPRASFDGCSRYSEVCTSTNSRRCRQCSAQNALASWWGLVKVAPEADDGLMSGGQEAFVRRWVARDKGEAVWTYRTSDRPDIQRAIDYRANHPEDRTHLLHEDKHVDSSGARPPSFFLHPTPS